MPDNTKCEGVTCKVRDKCWRYVSPRQTRQQYCAFYASISFTVDNGCEYMEPLPPNGTDYFRVKAIV